MGLFWNKNGFYSQKDFVSKTTIEAALKLGEFFVN